MGEIAIAEGRGRQAVEEFWRSDSLPDGPSSSCLRCRLAEIGRAHAAAGSSDSAIVYLERFLLTPEVNSAATSLFGSDPLFLTPARERLGQLYEARGDIAKAAEHYRAFVELWKNADPELQPRVLEARRRLVKLTQIEKD